jgi:hypothetical protein
MHRTTPARAGTVLFLLLAAATLVSGPAVASEASQACASGEGVTVVVDATGTGENAEVGCAPGDPASGREALEAAGFEALDGDVPGFVCTIDGLPENCDFDTNGGRFWSYWEADPSGTWTSYAVGADDSDPRPGRVEGWFFGDGATAHRRVPRARR